MHIILIILVIFVIFVILIIIGQHKHILDMLAGPVL